MKTPLRSRRSGFTLVELLIVIAIIGILAGLVSSAIVKITGTAAKKRIENNAERLRAAIQEYWHDKGRWPIPSDAKPMLEKAGKKKKDVTNDSTAESNTETTYHYVLRYKGDGSAGDLGNNGLVVGNLFNVLLEDGSSRKDVLDLHNFQAPAEENPSKWPVFETVDAWEFHKDNPEKAPILVYFAKFIQCPKCDRWYFFSGTEACTYDGNHDGKPDCSFWEENGERPYRFTDGDRAKAVNGALPYTLKFDLNNNMVDVRSDPGEFQFQKPNP